MTTFYTHIESPVGPLMLTSEGGKITRLEMDGQKSQVHIQESWVRDDSQFMEARRQLDAYFEGSLQKFDLPIAIGGRVHRVMVWCELLNIPYGETRTYGEVARAIGQPKGSRAVGMANGLNPIAIIVPCHRVIGANGKLTGYGGGLDRKEWLLKHEMAHARVPQPLLFT